MGLFRALGLGERLNLSLSGVSIPDLEKPGFDSELKRFERYLSSTRSRKGGLRTDKTIGKYVYVVERLKEHLRGKGFQSFLEADEQTLKEFILNYEGVRYVLAKGGIWKIEKRGQIRWQHRNFAITVLRLLYKVLGSPKEGLKDLRLSMPIEKASRVQGPEEVLSIAEVIKMIAVWEAEPDARLKARNQALLAVLYEAGLRCGEAANLKLGDITPTDYGAKIYVAETKSGRSKVVPIVEAWSYLKRWIELHPFKDDPRAPLWLNLHLKEGGALGSGMIYTILKQSAKLAKIRKNVYPHLLRHTRATHLAKSVSENVLRKIMGWSPRSDAPAFYFHLSGRDVEDAVLAVYGLKPKEEPVLALRKRECPHCGYANPPHLVFCERCGKPIPTSMTILKELEEMEKSKREMEEVKARLKGIEDFMKLLLGRIPPSNALDLLSFFIQAQEARGRVVDLKVGTSEELKQVLKLDRGGT